MTTTGETTTLTVPEQPESLEEFLALRDVLAGTPEGGAVVMVLALMAYADACETGTDTGFGRAALTIAVDRSRLRESDEGYRGWDLTVRDLQHLALQFGHQSYAPRAYVMGTSPEDGYALPAPALSFEILRTPYSGDDAAGEVKVFVRCSGAASPRPVLLRRNDRGIWKALEWSSLTLGVMPVPTTVEDDL